LADELELVLLVARHRERAVRRRTEARRRALAPHRFRVFGRF
jgi:hypothetical protein